MPDVKSICGYPVHDETARRDAQNARDALETFKQETETAVNALRSEMVIAMNEAEQRINSTAETLTADAEQLAQTVNETMQTAQQGMNEQLTATQTALNQSISDLQTSIEAQLATLESKIPATSTGAAFEIQTGTLNDVNSSGKTVTFPTPFSGVPVVVATSGTEQTSLKIRDLTAESVRIVSGVENNDACQWIAIYIKPAEE